MHKSTIAFRLFEQMTNKLPKMRFTTSAQIAAILLLAAGLLLSSCEDVSKKQKLQKPFIIVNKYINYSSGNLCKYYYQDANGIEYEFNDLNEKYNVGDTLR
jgi:hypothetical protein